MENSLKIIVAAALAFGTLACGDAMDEPISPEERSAQQLDLSNADLQRTRPMLERCEDDCYDVIILRQSKENSGDDDDGFEVNQKHIDRSSNAFDGDPVPWPLDEKRED